MGFGVTISTPPGGNLGSMAVVFVRLLLLPFRVDEEPDPLALAFVVAAAFAPLVAAAALEPAALVAAAGGVEDASRHTSIQGAGMENEMRTCNLLALPSQYQSVYVFQRRWPRPGS